MSIGKKSLGSAGVLNLNHSILARTFFFFFFFYIYIEDIHIFGMNMPFISSSEAKNAYFMSGEATNEIYIFSLHEMK